MSEITYLVEEMKTQTEYNNSAFKVSDAAANEDDFGMESVGSCPTDNMPANLDELKEILSNFFFFFSTKNFYFCQLMPLMIFSSGNEKLF